MAILWNLIFLIQILGDNGKVRNGAGPEELDKPSHVLAILWISILNVIFDKIYQAHSALRDDSTLLELISECMSEILFSAAQDSHAGIINGNAFM